MSERKPGVVAVVGAKWGDEGKGKVVDYLIGQVGADLVVRSQGGPNAGHSIVTNSGAEYALHGIPSGILNPEVNNLIAAGCLVNPEGLLKEMDGLEKRGIDIGNLYLSPRAHLIMPFEQVMDGVQDSAKPKAEQVGTTKQGMGPTSADKAARVGFRVHDLKDPDHMMSQLARLLPERRLIFDFYTQQREDYDKYIKSPEYAEAIKAFELDLYPVRLKEWWDRLEGYVDPADNLVQQTLNRGGRILLEGAQGTMLDHRIGYPYCTPSDTTIGGLLAGAMIPPSWVRDTDFMAIRVQKAWESKVGGGPFPTKMPDEIADMYRDKTEYGVTSGRARQMGWPDGVASRLSQEANGFTDIIITKLDMLKGKGLVRFCEAYQLDDNIIPYPIDARDLARVVPIYSKRGYIFTENISGVDCPKDLGEEEIRFLNQHMSFYPGAKLLAVGTGRETSAMITF